MYDPGAGTHVGICGPKGMQFARIQKTLTTGNDLNRNNVSLFFFCYPVFETCINVFSGFCLYQGKMDIYPGWLLLAWKLNFFLFRWIWDYPPKITPKPSSQKDWIWVLLFVCLFIVILKDIKKLPLTEVNFTFPVTVLTWRWKASPGHYSALSLHAALSHHGGYWLFTSAAHILPLMDGGELVLRLQDFPASLLCCWGEGNFNTR